MEDSEVEEEKNSLENDLNIRKNPNIRIMLSERLEKLSIVDKLITQKHEILRQINDQIDPSLSENLKLYKMHLCSL